MVATFLPTEMAGRARFQGFFTPPENNIGLRSE